VKKSEMIALISNWLLEVAPETYKSQSSIGRNIHAEDLLSTIEAAGMLPPTTATFHNEWTIKLLDCVWDDEDSEAPSTPR
jgi:hypothetical protein